MLTLGADKGGGAAAAEAVKERQSLLLLQETKLAETKVICLTIGQPQHEQSRASVVLPAAAP